MGGKPSKQQQQLVEYTGQPESTEFFGVPGVVLAEMIRDKDEAKFKELGGAEGVANKLNSDLEKGICDDSFGQRQIQYGKNRSPDPVIVPFLKIWFEALKDKTLIILIIAAIVSLILALAVPKSTDRCIVAEASEEEEFNTEWIEGVAILAAVMIASLGSSISDYSKQKKFLALSEDEKDVKIKVIRNGEQHQISTFDLVVGDIINLDVGDVLPTDGIFVHGNDLRIDESDMTGESVAVKKSETNFYMMSGTKVTDGNGKMLVVAVGPNSMWGKTMEAVNKNKSNPTPLQENLDDIAMKIGYFGMFGGVLVFVALLIYYIVAEATHEPVYKESADHIKGCDPCPFEKGTPEFEAQCENYKFEASSMIVIVDYFILAVTIIVAAVPEGLPLAVTMSLAYSMKQMFKDNNLVRHLKACETMSNCTNICSDKTGTLTENRMTVVYGWFGGVRMESREGNFSIDEKYEQFIHTNIAINSSPSTTLVEEKGHINVIGNKTEGALLMFSKLRGKDYLATRKEKEADIYQMFAFSSAKKRMNTLVWEEKPNKIRMYTKGAPEMILEKCDSYMNANGEKIQLTDEIREELAQCQAEWASKGCRTLSLSMKETTPVNAEDLDAKYEEADETGSTLLCLFGIEDPLRPEVPHAVATCNNAGIIVRMVTGDNIATARSIAKQCNIISSDDDFCTEGPIFAKMTDEEILEKLPHLRVIARCSPQDKERLVRLLISQGEVVAVTGDGTNDVPALKAADVGLAMGIRGTDVAKQASDIVILDDNFQSIVNSVKWGRCVFDNIRKFLQFQLTVNVSAVFLCIIGSVFVGDSPLTALQMLWINMIMDTLAALALATEKPTDALLNRKPFGRYNSLISLKMLRFILSQAIFQLCCILPFMFAGKYIKALNAPCGFIKTVGKSGGYNYYDECAHFDEETSVSGEGYKTIADVEHDTRSLQSLCFNIFVFCQVVNLFNARKVNGEHNIFEGLFKNAYFIMIVGGIVIFQVIIIQFLGTIFDTIPFDPANGEYGLPGWHWLISIVLPLLSMIVNQLVLFIPVPETKPRKFKKSKGEPWYKKLFGKKKEYKEIDGGEKVPNEEVNATEKTAILANADN